MRRGCDLDDLLVPSLQRAVALVEVHDAAVPVGKDLHLDVTGVQYGLLHVDHRVPEGSRSLAHRRLDRLAELLGFAHPAQPAAPTT